MSLKLNKDYKINTDILAASMMKSQLAAKVASKKVNLTWKCSANNNVDYKYSVHTL